VISIDPDALDRRGLYDLLTSCILPRPIAWVTSQSPDGVCNAAPFSFFNGVSSQPPIISVAIGLRRGNKKDTLSNIEATGEFVVNVVDASMGQAMVDTSIEHPPEVDELEVVGLETEPSEVVTPPRIKGVPVAMECRLVQSVEVGGGVSTLVLGEVVRFHVREGIQHDDGRVDPTKWTPLGRLGGQGYSAVTEILEIPPSGA